MNLDLTSLFPDLEALTPDGRWELLQEWLRKNPKYAKRMKEWVNQSPNDVFIQLCLEYGKLPAGVVTTIVGAEMTQKILSAIEIIQTLYRERANNQTEKEIKNVKTKRTVKVGPARRNPKRASEH